MLAFLTFDISTSEIGTVYEYQGDQVYYTPREIFYHESIDKIVLLVQQGGTNNVGVSTTDPIGMILVISREFFPDIYT